MTVSCHRIIVKPTLSVNYKWVVGIVRFREHVSSVIMSEVNVSVKFLKLPRHVGSLVLRDIFSGLDELNILDLLTLLC